MDPAASLGRRAANEVARRAHCRQNHEGNTTPFPGEIPARRSGISPTAEVDIPATTLKNSSVRPGRPPVASAPMRMSSLFLRTLRDDPADAEVESHRLLVRAGYIRRISAGIYSWLPLGYRVLRNVEQIVREEMDEAGAQEALLSIVQPLELWERSGRETAYG